MKRIINFFRKFFMKKKIREEEEQEIVKKICRKIKESDELF